MEEASFDPKLSAGGGSIQSATLSGESSSTYLQ
jgi:hypothetical protein